MKLDPKATIFYTLKEMKIPFVQEYRFDKDRHFRFDFAILPFVRDPEKSNPFRSIQLIAIEYEGVFSGKSRHTTVGGYSRDTEKYNLATILGWKVLRYTAATRKNMRADLERLIYGKQ